MNINSKLVAVATVSAIAGATFLGANTVSAQTSGESLVSRIAERFDVSEAEVQEVVDEYKEAHHEEREAKRDEHLQGLVDDGTLSEEQRAELEAFGEQRHSQMEELREQGLSRQEIREAMEGLRDEVEAWAEAEGLELDDIRPQHKHGRRGNGFKAGLRDQLQEEFGEESASDAS